MASESGRVPLDLVPIELLAPRLRKIALIAVLIGVGVGAIVAIAWSFWIAVVIGVVIALPTAASALITLRRSISLQNNRIRSTGGLRSRHVDVAAAVTVELIVRVARVNEVSVRIADANSAVVVPLALYTADGGRELDILALRRLADSMSTSELVPAAAIASVLIEQLRSEARGAALVDRPLFRAVELVRAAGRAPRSTLTDHEVASLVD